jgi:hypothetical protein
MWRKIICFFASDSQMRKAFVFGLGWSVFAGGFFRQQDRATASTSTKISTSHNPLRGHYGGIPNI